MVIDSIEDVQSGLIYIPPVTGKTIWATCKMNDVQLDPFLNQLWESGQIYKYAVAVFPTLSSSHVWTQEEEYCSFLDLSLNKITPHDRLKGHAFILDADKLQKEFFPLKTPD